MKNYRQYFPIYKNNPDLVYLDTSATALKPQCVIDRINHYYCNVSSNSHRGEYKLSILADEEYSKLKSNLSKLLNAESGNEFVITSGATLASNQIFYGISDLCSENDEIITDIYEHSSIILPIFRLAKDKKMNIKYVSKKPSRITWDDIKKLITNKTKIIAINHVSNLIGFINELEKIGKNIHKNYPEIIFIIDIAQSIPHIKIDIRKIHCDFALFSAHKMFGPTGIGAFYLNKKWMGKLKPFVIGGGMFTKLNSKLCSFIPKSTSSEYEAGSLNVGGIFGFNAAVEFILKHNIEEFAKYEKELYEYAITKLSKLTNIDIINPNTDIGIIAFNHKTLFCQDVAMQLSTKNICVRAGQHCVKLSHKGTDQMTSVRVSLSIYNTKEDIDILADNIQNIGDGLDAFF